MNGFFNRVYEVVSRIPYGRVLSYGQIAQFLGSPRSSRLVGWAMHSCPNELPWYRVIKKTGEIPFSDESIEGITQRDHLEREGIEVSADGTIDMNRYEWIITLSD